MRPLRELINDDEPAWPMVQAWIAAAEVPVEILPARASDGESALLGCQVTTRSPMGAIALHTAGLLIDSGWLRVLGAGGHARLMRSLPNWNETRSDGFFLIADDAVGGSFALNGGALGEDRGQIYYFAPDTLNWESCSMGYSQFIVWAISRKIIQFYSSLQWSGWQDEVARLTGDEVMSIMPPLWAQGAAIADRSRRPIPMSEMFDLQFDFRRQMSFT